VIARSLEANHGRLLAHGRLARVRRIVAMIGFDLATSTSASIPSVTTGPWPACSAPLGIDYGGLSPHERRAPRR